MKSFFKVIFLCLMVISCRDDMALIPAGFEHISKDRNSHFIYVHPEFLGERVKQRETGRVICKEVFKEIDYCEIYFFKNKEEVPMKFPIMNRIHPIGYYEFKNGKEKFKALTEDDLATFE